MTNKYSKLFEPFMINKTEIKNRIVMAPMYPWGWYDADKALTNDLIEYFTERAKGGVGLIYTGASFPDISFKDNDFEKSVYATPDAFIPMAQRLADNLHKYGCKFFTQLQIGTGRNTVPVPGCTPVAPSVISNLWDPSVKCRPLETEEIYELIEKIVDAVALCQQAGADGMDINGVKGGYLGDTFAIEKFNQRTDEFGGSIDGRIKIMIDIIKGIKKRCGEDFPITTRLGPRSHMKGERDGHLPGEEYTEYGRDVEESLIIAKKLQDAGYDGILFGTGTYDACYWLYPPMYMPEGCVIEDAAIIKEALDIPVIVPGKLSDPDLAVEAINEGKIDAVGMGRGLVADPYWPIKVKSGKTEDIRHCIYCNNGCIGRVLAGLPMSCAVNPDVFHERQMSDKYKKVEKPKKIAIIGGGVAGLEAARVAAMRGHDVTIFEGNNRLGGLMIPAEVPDFKFRDKWLLDWFIKEINKLGVKVHLNTWIDAAAAEKLDADAIIVATGSTAKRLDIEGIENINAFSAEEVLLNPSIIKGKAVLIGAGQVGCETAIWLKSKKGVDIEIVEALPEILSGSQSVVPIQNFQMLTQLLKFHNIPVTTSADVKKVEKNGLIIDTSEGEKKIDAEAVIFSVGYVPNDGLYREIDCRLDKPVWKIGDAQAARTIMTAIQDGSAIGAIV